MSVLFVGQKLIFVPDHRNRSEPHEVEIASIARRWATLAKNWGRIDKHTLAMDGGQYSSPGRCYLSREHYEAEQRADRAWNRLSQRTAYRNRPPNLTAEKIAEAAALLGVDITEKPDG